MLLVMLLGRFFGLRLRLNIIVGVLWWVCCGKFRLLMNRCSYLW